ncbi:ABC transporter ATP-binding protein [Halobacterium sp. KA-4]|uniref:ABC transporter ATP-binding protein n=1 Tax=Halobacterium sp. KA-4 TaxID=2896367 RepID=UPI001E4B2383|nr:ABC transporter ATP-binding protein [Halobacterium sp. KA-4]MCD2201385.1 ABC transporter ATP-binding protein [Halobacterium sp. KA-4]
MNIQLEELTKRYGETEAVDSVSLTIHEGETFGLIGPSGCGKSTMLRMIAGFETPDHGDVIFDDSSVVDIPPQVRDVGLVFQSIALFNNMSVIENVAFGPRMRGVETEQRRGDAQDILELLDISELADRDPQNLSGGQKQRVALGRALAIEPRVLLLDEPMTGLDATLKRRLQTEMVALFDELDMTAIHVTHDQEEAMVMCDRIAVLNDGQIEQVGTPTELYESPANEFVADFLGTSNILDATARNGILDFGFAEVPFECAECGDVAVIVRPEHISPGSGSLRAKITNQFYLGEKVRTFGLLPDGGKIIFDVDRFVAQPGDEISLSMDTDRIRVIG